MVAQKWESTQCHRTVCKKWLKWKPLCYVHCTIIKVYIKVFHFKMYMAEKI